MALVQFNKKLNDSFDQNEMQRFCRLQVDHLWIISHKSKLRKEYADKYIAVQNQAVYFIGKDIEELIANIITNNKHVDDFAIDFVGKYPTNLLL